MARDMLVIRVAVRSVVDGCFLAHDFGGDGVEVAAALPIDLADADQVEVGLVKEGGRLEGVVGAFSGEDAGCAAAQFLIDGGVEELAR